MEHQHRKGRTLGISLMLMFLGSLAPLAAQETYGGGILYGANWGCAVTAPQNWIMDQSTWAKNNIFALFYEKGKAFGPAIPIVYINTQQLNAATDEEMMAYLNWDLGNTRKDPQNKVTVRDLGPGLNKKPVCYDFNFGNRQYETIAYLRFKDTCFLVILAAHDKGQIETALPKLKEVINSMAFMDKS